MPNTNFQTIFQMGQAINDMVKQATGRDVVKEIEMGQVTVAQNHISTEHTYSGAVVSFVTNDEYPMQIGVDINPVQDLHGYDHPWPGGAGKNLLDDSEIKRGYYNPDSMVFVSDTKYASYNTTLPAGEYTFSTDLPNCWIIRYWIDNVETTVSVSRQYVTFTISAEADFKISIRNTSTTDIGDVTIKSMIESGSIATTYTPYANICPISGWTGAEITRTGKNLFDKNIQTFDGALSANGTISTNSNYKYTDFIPVKSSTDYCLSGTTTANSSAYCSIAFYDADKIFRRRIIASTGGTAYGAFTTDDDEKFIRININTRSNTMSTVQLEEGSEASEYESFGQIYPITFPTSAGTVYGGTLTINKDGTGTLVIEWANIASYDGEELPGVWISDRDVYAEGTTPTTGAQVVYELAEPVTVTLEAEEITTLTGENNVWSDTGNITVSYDEITEGGGV